MWQSTKQQQQQNNMFSSSVISSLSIFRSGIKNP
jgi:hypothetical protein